MYVNIYQIKKAGYNQNEEEFPLNEQNYKSNDRFLLNIYSNENKYLEINPKISNNLDNLNYEELNTSYKNNVKRNDMEKRNNSM
jgi:hypothetical protein